MLTTNLTHPTSDAVSTPPRFGSLFHAASPRRWNAEPEVVRFYESEGPAKLDTYIPETGWFEPPADTTDLFTYHAVMPPPWPVTLPTEVKSLDEIGPRKRLLDGPLFRGVRVGRVWVVKDEAGGGADGDG